MSEAHGLIEGSNKRIALLISVLALCLALADTLAKGAQTNALSLNVEASNLWAFFQAKTIRQTTLRTASEFADLERPRTSDTAALDAIAKQKEAWAKTIARWESEPETGEGRKELTVRAKQAEETRNLTTARYHHYEISAAAFQIAIVLASASVITGIAMLTWLAGGLGLIGVAFAATGLFTPHLVHLF